MRAYREWKAWQPCDHIDVKELEVGIVDGAAITGIWSK